MKKILALLLAAVMCLSLVACGGENDAPEASDAPIETTAPEEVKMSKDEMLAVAEEYSSADIQNDSIENIVSAKQKYCNKTLLLSGAVRNIEEDHIELAPFYSSNYMIDVYLSIDDLVLLERGQSITVVGTTTDEIIDDSENIAEYTFNYSHYQMPVAYLVKDTVEVTGILKGVSNSYAPAFNIEIGSSNVLKLIYFAESVDTSTLEYGQKITFVAKAISENDNWHYYDAEIID